jgi:transitional endoplasmic reticulum ATPase
MRGVRLSRTIILGLPDEAVIEDPESARRFGIDPPTGLLLAGPPGTGKTTVAKVLAAQARCSFYAVSGADVMSKWVGESEGNIRRLFERARANRPSIVFIDEIDAIAGRRGAVEVHDTQVNQLLAEIDGVAGQRGVFVVGASNRPDQIDPAMLRGGRLSRTIILGLPDEAGRRRSCGCTPPGCRPWTCASTSWRTRPRGCRPRTSRRSARRRAWRR